MKQDILLVDDQEKWVRHMSNIVSRTRFNPVGFTDFYVALNYVIEKAGDWYACFVDMKPILKVPGESVITDEERELLKTPERIFDAAKSKGFDNRFYFISNHISKHDKGVLERTGTGFIQKPYLSERISEILGE
jgi:hypothetical protein